jgi:hypothetical protein
MILVIASPETFWNEAYLRFDRDLISKVKRIAFEIHLKDGRIYVLLSGLHALRGWHGVTVERWGPQPEWSLTNEAEDLIRIAEYP